ncbi:MAG: phosphoglycerate mutase family protein [Oligoflexia bacterium]|nr:phosphoglycerate mutase family protein [Oligoflexia bacterium]
MHKTLVILRHAHRDKDLGSKFDNGLSEKGKKQAKLAADLFKKRFCSGKKKTKALLFSSPKKRCQETLAPLAHQLGVDVEILPFLDEADSFADLSDHIREFKTFWNACDEPLVVICSHGDWIPAFLDSVTGRPDELAKGGWAQIERESGHEKPKLVEIIQDLRDVR